MNPWPLKTDFNYRRENHDSQISITKRAFSVDMLENYIRILIVHPYILLTYVFIRNFVIHLCIGVLIIN